MGGGSCSGEGFQVDRGLFRWGAGCSGGRGGSVGEGSKGANVRGMKLNGIFLQFEFRFWNALGQAVHSLCKVSASLT